MYEIGMQPQMSSLNYRTEGYSLQVDSFIYNPRTYIYLIKPNHVEIFDTN